MRIRLKYSSLVALLVMGGAISLLSCGKEAKHTADMSKETLMSEMSTNLTIIVSENGRPSYRFTTPLVEGYSLAREPYREFRKGVNIVTFKDDSMHNEESHMRSNYAIYYSRLKLWEAKGDVVATNSEGKELYTQQLFWNSTTRRIYSNVDSKIVDNVTGDIYIGEGFESDEEMEEWKFRKMKGTMRVDTSTTSRDSTQMDNASAEPKAKPAPKPKSATSGSTSSVSRVGESPKNETKPTSPHVAKPIASTASERPSQNVAIERHDIKLQQ